jgi:hypothetical protein
MDWSALIAAYLPRILGVAAAMVTTKLGEKTGVIVDPSSLVVAGLAAYAGVHRAASTKLNPGDAAKSRMIDADKVAVATGTVVKPAPPTS